MPGADANQPDGAGAAIVGGRDQDVAHHNNRASETTIKTNWMMKSRVVCRVCMASPRPPRAVLDQDEQVFCPAKHLGRGGGRLIGDRDQRVGPDPIMSTEASPPAALARP